MEEKMIRHCLRAILSKSKMSMVQALRMVQGLYPSVRVSGMSRQKSSRKKVEASFRWTFLLFPWQTVSPLLI
uniref:Uncharacterized protein n=1 Tax=Arundo donax TaxID=35708 RepID=A0A0A9G3J7_ARUDO